jgi:hypothetical protein
MNNYIMPHALSDIKSLHVTCYGWHDLPQGLWIINEYFNVACIQNDNAEDAHAVGSQIIIKLFIELCFSKFSVRDRVF